MKKDSSLGDVLFDGSTRSVTVEYKGKTIEVEYWPLTWEKRTKAEDTSTSYYKDAKTGKMMFRRNVGDYQIALLKSLVKDTNIPEVPGNGWLRLPAELGELIFEAVMEVETANEEEKEEAKNLSTDEGATTESAPESNEQVTSST